MLQFTYTPTKTILGKLKICCQAESYSINSNPLSMFLLVLCLVYFVGFFWTRWSSRIPRRTGNLLSLSTLHIHKAIDIKPEKQFWHHRYSLINHYRTSSRKYDLGFWFRVVIISVITFQGPGGAQGRHGEPGPRGPNVSEHAPCSCLPCDFMLYSTFYAHLCST